MGIVLSPCSLQTRRSYGQRLLKAVWKNDLVMATKEINDLEFAEKKIANLTWIDFKNKTHRGVSKNTEPISQVILISEAHKWRKCFTQFLIQQCSNDDEYKDLAKEKKNWVKKMINRVQASHSFHHYRTNDLIRILNHDWPFLEESMLQGQRDMDWYGWLMPLSLRKKYQRWLMEFINTVQQIKNEFVAALLLRLEVSAGMNDPSYDDVSVSIAHRFHEWGLSLPQSGILSNAITREGMPLYQRHGWETISYHYAIQFIQLHGDDKSKHRLAALPLYQRSQSDFHTVNKWVGNVVVPVPLSLLSFIPYTLKLPRFLFSATHLRGRILQQHLLLIAQLKIPLPSLQSISLKRSQLEKITYHPFYSALEHRRQLLEASLNEMKHHYGKLHWFQGKTKVFLKQYQSLLNKELKQTQQQERLFFQRVREVAYPYKKRLTSEAVLALQEALNQFHTAHDHWRNQERDLNYYAQLKQNLQELITVEKQLDQGHFALQQMRDLATDIQQGERAITERAKALIRNRPAMVDPEQEECWNIIDALSQEKPLPLMNTWGSITCLVHAHLQDESAHEQASWQFNLLQLEQACKQQKKLQLDYHSIAKKWIHDCEQPPLNRLMSTEAGNVLLIPQEMHTQWGNSHVDLLHDWQQAFHQWKKESREKQTALIEYEKEIGLEEDGEPKGKVQSTWNHLTQLLISDDVYACILDNTHENTLGSPGLSLSSVEDRQYQVGVWQDRLHQQVKEHEGDHIFLKKLHHQLEPSLRSLKKSEEMSWGEEAMQWESLHKEWQVLNGESLPPVQEAAERLLLPLQTFQFSLLSPACSKQKLAESNDYSLDPHINKMISDAAQELTKLLEQKSHLYSAECALTPTIAIEVSRIIRLGEAIRQFGDSSANEHLDYLLKKLLFHYCRRWQDDSLSQYAHRHISLVQEKIWLALTREISQKIPQFFQRRMHLLGKKEEIEAWQQVCHKMERRAIRKPLREVLNQLTLTQTHYFHVLMEVSRHSDIGLFYQLRDRMLSLGIDNMALSPFPLTAEEANVFHMDTVPQIKKPHWLTFSWQTKRRPEKLEAKREQMQTAMANLVTLKRNIDKLITKLDSITPEEVEQVQRECLSLITEATSHSSLITTPTLRKKK